MRTNTLQMWSSSSIDLQTKDLVTGRERPDYEPTPYTFTTLENGKKTTVDSTSICPPSWLLLDHTCAVIWSMFSLNQCLKQLSIEDLKWAYEFLKEIRNRKGESPPDVKVCLKEIQDRLINLYARLTSLNEEDFDELAAAFGEKIMADSATSYMNISSLMPKKNDSRLDTSSICSSLSSSRTTIKMPLTGLFNRHSQKALTVAKKPGNSKHKRIARNYSKKTFPLLEKDSNIFEEPENTEDEEVEKYILSLFDEEKEELPTKHSAKSFIPTKLKPTTVSFSEMISTRDSSTDITNKKSSKKVRCVAEMRSLKFQKSMKVQDTNGEEAAYSNLKAEIRRLTINPNVSRSEIMKFLKEWRSEQVDRLHNELKRLNSIEE